MSSTEPTSRPVEFYASSILMIAGVSLANGALIRVLSSDTFSLFQEANWLDENGVQSGTTLSVGNASNFENYKFDGTTASLLATGNFGSNSKVFVQFDDLTLREVTANPDGMNATGGSTTINLEDSSRIVSRSFIDKAFR